MITRKFLNGCEWIYVKIYSGPLTLEKILIQDIYPLIQQFYKELYIDQFFFIRYFDEDSHLRMRFKVMGKLQAKCTLDILNEKFEDLISQKLIWNVSFNIYNREIERYGSENILDCETIFSYNSYFSIKCLSQCLHLSQTDIRWVWAFRSLDTLYDNFNLSLEQKINFLESVISGYSSEYNLSKFSLRKLDDKYRALSKEIEGCMTDKNKEVIKMPDKIEVSYFKSIENILHRYSTTQVEPQFNHLLSSIVHMNMNRLFHTEQRRNEFVVCFLMNKFYKSLRARTKNQKSHEL